MDLYQIFITHNRAWTLREILAFSILFLFAVYMTYRLLCCQKIVLSQGIAGLLMLSFLTIVFGSTVFTRNPTGLHEYQLELFWSWKAVANGSREMLKENLLNMVLLLPAGILLPVMFRKRISWWKGFLIGAAISAGIESSQLILCRGLFEWDDIIHNGIGCMLGCAVTNAVTRWRKGKNSRE